MAYHRWFGQLEFPEARTECDIHLRELLKRPITVGLIILTVFPEA
jgi:hypothetical protein